MTLACVESATVATPPTPPSAVELGAAGVVRKVTTPRVVGTLVVAVVADRAQSTLSQALHVPLVVDVAPLRNCEPAVHVGCGRHA